MTRDAVLDQLAASAQRSACDGRAFSAHLRAYADAHQVSPPALASALAIVFAGLIVDLDGDVSLYEHFGIGLATDEARIDLLVEQVRAALVEMRAYQERPACWRTGRSTRS